ncbi:MAG: hypothetical protein GF411_03070 [Candidatus Lokiarchaeota archaeon]|nr:hypothetical protein [Candidatus Lokiarchaeota archaeon]
MPKKEHNFYENLSIQEMTAMEVSNEDYDNYDCQTTDDTEIPFEQREEVQVYNESFQDDSDVVTQLPFIVLEQDSSGNNIIGRIIVRKGQVIKYEINDELLWAHVLRIIHHRLKLSGKNGCLINLRTISKQIVRECNIKSIKSVEGALIRLMSERFGVQDIDSEKIPRGLKKLRGTAEMWGTVGSRTKHNRKRVARVYAIRKPLQVMEYIEGVIQIDDE